MRRAAGIGFLCLVPFLAGAPGCGREDSTDPDDGVEPRPFLMALSPFPAEPTVASYIAAFDYVVGHADAVLLMEDRGIPWTELIEGRPVPGDLADDIAYRAGRARAAGRRIFLAATPLDAARSGLLRQWNAASVPPELAGAGPSDPRVRQAYVAWCLDLVEAYRPDYFAAVIEANLYAAHSPNGWADLVDLYGRVYEAVKERSPALPVFVTLQLETMNGALLAGGTPQWPLLADLSARLDRIALSTYPSVIGGSAETLDAAYFAAAREAARAYSQAPLLVSETGWPSETVGVGGSTYPGSLDAQRKFLAVLLDAAASVPFEMVTWIFPFDFPAMYEAIARELPPGEAEALRLFVPMGLNEEGGTAKPAGTLWTETAAQPPATD